MYGKKETENRRGVVWVFCFCFSPFRLKLKVKFPRVTQHASLLILLLHVLGTLLEAPQCSAGCWLSGKGVQQYWTRNKETMWERCTNMNVCQEGLGLLKPGSCSAPAIVLSNFPSSTQSQSSAKLLVFCRKKKKRKKK